MQNPPHSFKRTKEKENIAMVAKIKNRHWKRRQSRCIGEDIAKKKMAAAG